MQYGIICCVCVNCLNISNIINRSQYSLRFLNFWKRASSL
ncbi:MAG: DUF645 family protein [Clostridia bacterium]|nr:DUF645 family protein [Clostridia bacterium]